MTRLYLHLKESDQLNTIIFDDTNDLLTIKDIINYSLKFYKS